ncbi:MAG: hypothetical protein AAB849_00720 [Patescibacteria group bacterium]
MILVKILFRYKHLLLLAAATIFLLSLPVINLFFAKDFKWIGPATITGAVHGDWKYYEPRIREILDGHPFIGNPFLIEYNNELPPAFFFADWLAAIPMLLGLFLEWGTIVNDMLWSLLFVFLAYGILQQAGVSKWLSVFGAELTFFQVFYLMTATVSMQTIFPFYLFFLFSFLFWIKDHKNKKRTVLLILSSTLSFYVYTYLWQVVVTALGLAFLFWLVTKKKEMTVGLIKILGLTTIFSLPLFIFTYLQIIHPYYWDTMQRIGLVSTRLPTAEVFYSGRWVVLMMLLCFFVFCWIKKIRENQMYRLLMIFFVINGFSLIIVSASNVITGKDLELAQHIVRFILVWMPLAFIVFLSLIKDSAAQFKLFCSYKKIIIFVLCLTYLFGLVSYYKGYLYSFFNRQRLWQHIVDNQKMNEPLSWLENEESKSVVVWAEPDSLTNAYIPTLTKHYILGGGLFQLVPSQEIEERYLVSNYFNQLSLDDIKKDFALYAGSGNAIHPAKIYNRKVVLCKFFRLNLFGANCGEKTDPITLKGEKYFTDLYDKYAKEIVPNIGSYLTKYKVSYYVKDRRINSGAQPEKIGMKRVYSDMNFDIYKIKDF